MDVWMYVCMYVYMYMSYLQASGPQLVGGISGESEERVRQIFQDALDAYYFFF